MNSVHELIAFFVQRGSCIESIYLRKEKQRHFCQDTYFRSPPRFDSPSPTKKGFCKKRSVTVQVPFPLSSHLGIQWLIFPAAAFVLLRKDVGQKKNAACDVTKATSSEMVQTFAVQTLPCRGQQLALSHPQECCHFLWPSFFCWHCWHIIRVIAACPDWNVCGTGICFWLRRAVYPLRCERSYARNAAEVVR